MARVLLAANFWNVVMTNPMALCRVSLWVLIRETIAIAKV